MQCLWRDGGCAGSNNDGCNPNHVWTGSIQSGSVYYDRYLNSGGFNSNKYAFTYAFSVRCVPGFIHTTLSHRYSLYVLTEPAYCLLHMATLHQSSCATSMLQALCGAEIWVVAVRALQTLPATQTTCGQVPQVQIHMLFQT